MNAALVLLLIALSPQAPEKVLLRFQPRAGDVLETEETTALDMKAFSRLDEWDIVRRTRTRSVTEVAEVEGDRINRLVVRFVEDVEDRKELPSGEYRRRPTPLHGKTVTLSRKEGRVAIEGAGEFDETQRSKLWLDYPQARFFPKDPVAPGDFWEFTGEALKAAVPDQAFEGKVRFTLREIREIDGRRCAVLSGEFDLQRPARGENPLMKVQYEAAWTVWIDRGYVLYAKAIGGITERGGADRNYRARGPYSSEIKVTVKSP